MACSKDGEASLNILLNGERIEEVEEYTKYKKVNIYILRRIFQVKAYLIVTISRK